MCTRFELAGELNDDGGLLNLIGALQVETADGCLTIQFEVESEVYDAPEENTVEPHPEIGMPVDEGFIALFDDEDEDFGGLDFFNPDVEVEVSAGEVDCNCPICEPSMYEGIDLDTAEGAREATLRRLRNSDQSDSFYQLMTMMFGGDPIAAIEAEIESERMAEAEESLSELEETIAELRFQSAIQDLLEGLMDRKMS